MAESNGADPAQAGTRIQASVPERQVASAGGGRNGRNQNGNGAAGKSRTQAIQQAGRIYGRQKSSRQVKPQAGATVERR